MMMRAKLMTDWQLGIAITAAPVLWALLWWMEPLQPSLNWITGAPWLFVSLVFAQPVLEEFVFRGWLQGWFIGKEWGSHRLLNISSANMLTSVVFVVMHLFYHAPLMALLVFIPSLVFGYFRDRYDGWLMPGILLHCFYNTGYFLLYAPVSAPAS